jgi:hypothetical protein
MSLLYQIDPPLHAALWLDSVSAGRNTLFVEFPKYRTQERQYSIFIQEAVK